jgi:ABC-type multidrug transport system fused ATPase/permease subunit
MSLAFLTCTHTLLRCMFTIFSTLVVISVATHWFAIAIAPIVVVYTLIQRYYIPTSRELQRLESVTRSPIYANFSETLNGIVTVRAYRLGGHFTKLSDRMMEVNAAAYLTQKLAQMWCVKGSGHTSGAPYRETRRDSREDREEKRAPCCVHGGPDNCRRPRGAQDVAAGTSHQLRRCILTAPLFFALRTRRLNMRLEFIGMTIIGFTAFLSIEGNTPPTLAALALVYSLEVTRYLKHGTDQASQAEAKMNAVERLLEYTDEPTEAAAVTTSEVAKSLPSDWPAAGALEVRFSHSMMEYDVARFCA